MTVPKRFTVMREGEHWALYEMTGPYLKRLVATDGGEPEDQSLVRDWKWVVEELNKLADEAKDWREAGLTEQRMRVETHYALRALLAAIADEESNRDGAYLLPPDTGCVRCTVGTRSTGPLCARHAAERVLEGTR